MSMGGGAADGLKDVLARLFQEAQFKQLQKQQAMQSEAQSRGLGLQEEGLGLQRGRLNEDQRQFDTVRDDRQSAAAADQAAALKAAEGMEEFELTLPEHARQGYHASGHKQNLTPAMLANAPETLDQQGVRSLKEKQDESDIRLRGELRMIGARGAEDRRTDAARPRAADAAVPAQTAQQANELDDSMALVDQMLEDKALPTAVGPMDQYVGVAMDPAGVTRFKALEEQLAGKLSLAQSGKLKGQGAVSNVERDLLRQAATALRRGLSEEDYKTELKKIRSQFERMRSPTAVTVDPKTGPAAAPAAPTTGGGEFDFVPGKGLVPRGTK